MKAWVNKNLIKMCELLGNLITYVRELRMATESLRFSFWCVLFHAVTSILAQERLTLSSLLSTQKGRLSSQHVFWRIYKPFIHATDAGETKCHLISPAKSNFKQSLRADHFLEICKVVLDHVVTNFYWVRSALFRFIWVSFSKIFCMDLPLIWAKHES